MSRSARHSADVSLRSLKRSLPMELLKAREAAMTRFRPMLRAFGLTEQQWRVIRVLAEYRKLDATDLARRSMLLGPSVTRILQFLESNGLISRLEDQTDQRRVVLSLTAKGRRVFDTIAPESEAIYAQIESDFGQEKMTVLYTLLSEFFVALSENESG